MTLRRFSGSAVEFHERPLGSLDGVELWSFSVERPAIVLGSRQSPDVLDVAACDARGVEIVHRRSGGGVVLLEPGAVEWVDVVVPTDSPWWTDDVVGALIRCGRVWLDALERAGVAESLTAYEGRLRRDRLSDLVCFAGLGAGEVVDATGAKLVGISQRRTRHGARLQCAVHRRWDPASLHALLVPGLVTLADAESIAVATVQVDRGALLTALDAAVTTAVTSG